MAAASRVICCRNGCPEQLVGVTLAGMTPPRAALLGLLGLAAASTTMATLLTRLFVQALHDITVELP